MTDFKKHLKNNKKATFDGYLLQYKYKKFYPNQKLKNTKQASVYQEMPQINNQQQKREIG